MPLLKGRHGSGLHVRLNQRGPDTALMLRPSGRVAHGHRGSGLGRKGEGNEQSWAWQRPPEGRWLHRPPWAPQPQGAGARVPPSTFSGDRTGHSGPRRLLFHADSARAEGLRAEARAPTPRGPGRRDTAGPLGLSRSPHRAHPRGSPTCSAASATASRPPCRRGRRSTAGRRRSSSWWRTT